MVRPSSSAPPTPSLPFSHGPPDWPAVSDIFSDLPGPIIAGPAHSDKGEDVPGYLAASFHLTRRKLEVHMEAAMPCKKKNPRAFLLSGKCSRALGTQQSSEDKVRLCSGDS